MSEMKTYSSVGPIPSSYSIGRDKLLNVWMDFAESLPNRISFSMSMNSGTVELENIVDKIYETLTRVSLPEDLSEVERFLDGLTPKVSIEGKGYRFILSHWRKLEKVPRHNNLRWLESKNID